MSAPRLDRKMVLEAPQQTADGAGGFQETWTAKGTLWAHLASGYGREDQEGGQPVARVTYRITVRAAPPGAASRPAPGQRLSEGPRRFRIFAVGESRWGVKYLTCFASEEVVA